MTLTEQAKTYLEMAAAADAPPLESLTPVEARAAFDAMEAMFGTGPDLAQVEDRVIPGDIKVRIYSDASDGSLRPGLMYFHGGGWVIGNLASHDALCRRLAKESQCAVVAVDYALAPENPYPKPFDDCFVATKHVADNAKNFGIVDSRLAVAGDSAGGNLAAAVCLKSRDSGGPAIQLQVLIYPAIGPRYDTESYKQCAEGYGLELNTMVWFWNHYLGEQTPDHYADPSLAASLAGLPRAHVITAGYDVLRDEGEAYAAQLAAAGVPTSTRRYEGNLHGFVQFGGFFEDGSKATSEIAAVVKEHLCG